MWPFLSLIAVAAEPDSLEPTVLAGRVLTQMQAKYQNGQSSAEDVYTWSKRLLEAEGGQDNPASVRRHTERMEALLEQAQTLAAAGMTPVMEIDATRFYVAEAQTWSGATPEEAVETPLPPGDIDGCFSSCDKVFAACSTEAEHFRLGVGGVTADPACDARALSKCGNGPSAAKSTCREQESRTCQASARQAICAQEQTRCSARCR